MGITKKGAVMADAKKKPQPVDILAFELSKAKKLEASAREKRVQIEEQLIELMGVREEGATTNEGNFFKVTTTGKLTRKLDVKAFAEIKSKFRGPAPVKTTVSLDVRAFKKLAVEEPDLYQLMCETCIETKPAKTSVAVVEVSDED
tara:strand:- start:1 stop:438 length:438 start_codon:yes stop_codon:yes gene_type:complete